MCIDSEYTKSYREKWRFARGERVREMTGFLFTIFCVNEPTRHAAVCVNKPDALQRSMARRLVRTPLRTVSLDALPLLRRSRHTATDEHDSLATAAKLTQPIGQRGHRSSRPVRRRERGGETYIGLWVDWLPRSRLCVIMRFRAVIALKVRLRSGSQRCWLANGKRKRFSGRFKLRSCSTAEFRMFSMRTYAFTFDQYSSIRLRSALRLGW